MRGNRAAAEDALGSAALKALYKTRARAGHITDLRPWLSRLIYNHRLDLHRERRRRQRAEDARITMATDPGIFTSIPSSPEENLWCNEITRFTEITVNNLPRHLREPFRMRIIDELSYQEIAAVLALSPENVRKRVQLAREALRQTVARYLSGRERAATATWATAAPRAKKTARGHPPGRRGRTVTAADRA